MHGCRWSRTLYLSQFLTGTDGLFAVKLVYLFSKKHMLPGPFLCCLHCWILTCYRNCHAFRHWLKHTQINFPWEKELADPEGLHFLSSGCSNAIDFIVKPEQRGSRELHKTKRENAREKPLLIHVHGMADEIQENNSKPSPGEQKFSEVALA